MVAHEQTKLEAEKEQSRTLEQRLLERERELAERKEEQEHELRARLDKAHQDEQRSEERRLQGQQRLEAAQKRLAEILKSTHSISCLYMVKLLERSIFHDVFRRRRSGRRKDGAKP